MSEPEAQASSSAMTIAGSGLTRVSPLPHRFGSCQGRLVVDNGGVRFQTTHRDAFSVAYLDIEMFEVDPGPRTLRIKLRGGRGYTFRSDIGPEGQLSAFHAAVSQLRTTLANSAP